MRTLLLLLAAVLVVPTAAAQSSFLPYIGYNTDSENATVGVGTRFGLPLPTPIALSVQPAVEVELTDTDGVTLLQGDINVIAALPAAAVAPYVGAGLALRYLDVDGVGSETIEGLNLLAGVTLNPIGFAQPFAQARYSIFDGGEQLSVMGGVALGL